MTRALTTVDRVAGFMLRAIPCVCLAGLLVVLFVNVVSRTLGLWSFPWFDEIVEALFAWMVFVGAAALWREKEHFRVDWLEAMLGKGARREILNLLIHLLSLVFIVLMTWTGLDLTLRSRAVTPILSIPVAFLYASIPFAGLTMCIYSMADLYRSACRFFAVFNPATQETKA